MQNIHYLNTSDVNINHSHTNNIRLCINTLYKKFSISLYLRMIGVKIRCSGKTNANYKVFNTVNFMNYLLSTVYCSNSISIKTICFIPFIQRYIIALYKNGYVTKVCYETYNEKLHSNNKKWEMLFLREPFKIIIRNINRLKRNIIILMY